MIRGNLWLAALAVALAGCAHTYVDGEGNTHVIGVVHMVVPKLVDTDAAQAQSLQVRSIGLSLLTAAERTSLTIGYNDDTLVLVRGSACVALGRGLRLTSLAPHTMADFALIGDHEQ